MLRVNKSKLVMLDHVLELLQNLTLGAVNLFSLFDIHDT